MQQLPKIKVIFHPNDPERMYVCDEKDFFPYYFLGLDGHLYENYGSKEKPDWEPVFDADYDIEITIGDKTFKC